MDDVVRLLIVDDDPLGGRILSEHLAKSGYEVVVEPDGEAALAHFSQPAHEAGSSGNISQPAHEAGSSGNISQPAHEPPDAVIIDVLLPKISGVELARRIRAMPGGARTAIFLMSGVYGSRDMLEDAVKTFGFAGYFVKPFQVKVLVEKLREKVQPAKERDSSSGDAKT